MKPGTEIAWLALVDDLRTDLDRGVWISADSWESSVVSFLKCFSDTGVESELALAFAGPQTERGGGGF